jgi:hypothetical protein
VSQRLQKEGKVKWGYVGGMSMNNTWFSLWWTMWANNCDILKPLFERDNDKLAAAKFEPAVTEPCHREIVEFWWDAINTHKISWARCVSIRCFAPTRFAIAPRSGVAL